MNVLHLHSSDHLGGGGGTVAMERLHLALRKHGVDSRIVAGRKTSPSPYSYGIRSGRPLKRLESLIGAVTERAGLKDLDHLDSFGVAGYPAFKAADLLHVHGTHGFFNYLALAKLARAKPTLYTLHDMWPLTGHCSYSFGCERWRLGCGHCPHLDAHPAVKRDNTRVEWRLKRWLYSRCELTIVAVSRWIESIARDGLFSHYRVEYIPNGIDTSVYRDVDKSVCREALGIPPDKHVLMFVSLRLDDRRKGGDLLLDALRGLPGHLAKDTVLMVLGDAGHGFDQALGWQVLNLGYVRSDALKAAAYSAADLFVFPTRADNLPLVLLESAACATPSVSFRVGGVPEIVRHEQTGWLAEEGDSEGFLDGIVQLIEQPERRLRLGAASRRLMETEYSEVTNLERHLALYREILGWHGQLGGRPRSPHRGGDTPPESDVEDFSPGRVA